MAKVIDFKNVPVELRIGEPEPTDVRRSVGNAINRNTSDIGLADFARKVFYSEEPVEIPTEYIVEITQSGRFGLDTRSNGGNPGRSRR